MIKVIKLNEKFNNSSLFNYPKGKALFASNTFFFKNLLLFQT